MPEETVELEDNELEEKLTIGQKLRILSDKRTTKLIDIFLVVTVETAKLFAKWYATTGVNSTSLTSAPLTLALTNHRGVIREKINERLAKLGFKNIVIAETQNTNGTYQFRIEYAW